MMVLLQFRRERHGGSSKGRIMRFRTVSAVSIACALILSFYAVSVVAQPLQLSNAVVASGKNALSDGLSASLTFNHGKDSTSPFEATLIADAGQAYALVRTHRFGGPRTNVELIWSGGQFEQGLWFAPMITINYSGSFYSTHWAGPTIGEVGKPYLGLRKMFSWQEFGYSSPHFAAYYAALNYAPSGGRRQDIIGTTFKVNPSPQLQVQLSWDRDTSNASWCVEPIRDMFTIRFKFWPRGRS